MLSRKRIMAAKIETDAGTAVSLAAADALFVAYDLKIDRDTEFEERPAEQGSFSRPYGVTGADKGTATFSVEVIPGLSPHPSWALTLLPACGFVATGAVYSPVSEAPGTNVKCITIGGYLDGKFKSLKGAAGNAVFRFSNGKVARIDFTFQGIWVNPSDVALIAPTFPTTSPLRFKAATLTLTSGSDAWTPKVSEMTLDLGNEVVMREDASDASGYAHAMIVDRKPTGTVNPESSLIATRDIDSRYRNSTEHALSMTLGSGAGGRVKFDAPALQFAQVADGNRNKVDTDDITYQLNKSASAGDDELTITLL